MILPSSGAPVLGKLIRFFVDSGDHINAGEQYAEIEVRPVHVEVLFADGDDYFPNRL